MTDLPEGVFEQADGLIWEDDVSGLDALAGSHAAFPLAHGEDLLERAVGWGKPRALGWLLSKGVPPVMDHGDGFPVLHAALCGPKETRVAILRILLDAGVDPNQRGMNDWTPLHRAAAEGDLASLKVLLEAGANPSLRTDIDHVATPEEEARFCNQAEAADLLARALQAGSQTL